MHIDNYNIPLALREILNFFELYINYIDILCRQ